MSPAAQQLDIRANRRAARYSHRENLARLAWALAAPLFAWSPRPFFAWRAGLLRLFGARIGAKVHIYPSTRVEMPWNLEIGDWSSLGEGVFVYSLGRVRIGERVTVSLRAFLCAGTHDHTRVDLPLLKPPILIEDDAWVCAEAYVGPGVRIGRGAVVAARAAAVKDVEPWDIVGGNPARPFARRRLQVDEADS